MILQKSFAVSFSIYHGCLLYGLRAVIPAKHRARGKQARIATKAQSNEVLRLVTSYEV